MTETFSFFVSDLHGSEHRYNKLFHRILEEKPTAVFMGGDLLPSGLLHAKSSALNEDDFVQTYLTSKLSSIRKELGKNCPDFFIILGNDDPRYEEVAMLNMTSKGLCHYIHKETIGFSGHSITGYSYIPPSPFPLKDWERYDVSRFVDLGCISPEEGYRSVKVSEDEIKYSTITEDLKILGQNISMETAVFLFHAPPYRTNLDRADLDGKMIEYVPFDVNVGSIAIERFIEENQPLLTLHGHIHESARITGNWRDKRGRTHLFSAAHDGPELALVRFKLNDLDNASRELI